MTIQRNRPQRPPVCVETVQRRQGMAIGMPMRFDTCGQRAHWRVRTERHPDGTAMCARHATPYRLAFAACGASDVLGVDELDAPPVDVECPSCRGAGWTATGACAPGCDGSHVNDPIPVQEQCPSCRGSGTISSHSNEGTTT